MISSRTAPVQASRKATPGSSNLGHSIPGVSSSSKLWSTGTHCLALVTPGRSSVLAVFRLATWLIKVDFPTLGMPRIITRTTRPAWPFSA